MDAFLSTVQLALGVLFVCMGIHLIGSKTYAAFVALIDYVLELVGIDVGGRK